MQKCEVTFLDDVLAVIQQKWQNRSCQKGIIRLSNLKSVPCEDLFKLLRRGAGVMTSFSSIRSQGWSFIT